MLCPLSGVPSRLPVKRLRTLSGPAPASLRGLSGEGWGKQAFAPPLGSTDNEPRQIAYLSLLSPVLTTSWKLRLVMIGRAGAETMQQALGTRVRALKHFDVRVQAVSSPLFTYDP